MFWPVRQKKDERKPETAKIGDRIQLDVAGTSYLTRIENLLSDGEMHVAAPLEENWRQSMSPHSRVTVNVFSETGFLRLATRVKGIVHDRVPLIILTRVKDLGAMDRRHYDRVAAELPVTYRTQCGAEDGIPWRSSVTTDVSGSGARIACDSLSGMQVKDYVDVQLSLPGEEVPITAVAQIVWTAQGSKDEKASLGFHFVAIQKAERWKIAKYVRTRQAWLKRLRREYDRVPAELFISYRMRSKNGSASWRSGVTTDISGSGVRFFCDNTSGLKANECVDVQLFLPQEEKPVEADAHIAWLATKSGKHVEPSVGLHFDSIPQLDRDRVLRYVEQKREWLSKLRYGNEPEDD